MKTLLSGFVLGLLSFSTPSHADVVTDECNQALQNVPGSYMSYVQKSEERRGASVDKHPEYLNPKKEREMAETLWKGEEAPALLAPYLPEGVTFINHSLKKASAPGVVKVEQPNGDFLMLRVEMPFKGRIIATNVTVNAQALYQNLARFRRGEKLWLIGPDATAALDWGHGGGTKTTGGHTADTLMNYMSKYNVSTFGMDQGFHGEGPRDWFEDDMEYFEFRVAFRKRFIHPDVPTFMIGHSFGGIIGDMAVRRSGKGYEKLGLKDVYAGIIPLSFVADPDPESPDFESKTTAGRIRDAQQKWADNEKWINEADLDLFASLMSQDKCSALSGLQCSQISLYNNWKMDDNILPKAQYLDSLQSTHDIKPSEGFRVPFEDFLNSNVAAQKDGPIPSLYFMGEHDALYVLHEDNIETYVRRLKNSILWTVSARVTFRGNVENVGHMIFDHFMPKKDSPEAISAMGAYLLAKNPTLAIPTNESELQTLFKSKVLNGVIKPYTFFTPANNYSSSLALMAYQWVPDFKVFLEGRIQKLAEEKGKSVRDVQPDYFINNYSEREVFETYQIIRDFVAAILKTKGTELKEIPTRERVRLGIEAGDPMAHSREAVISILKTYGNNLAFREFLDELKFMEIPATAEFQLMNEVGNNLANRQRMLETIRKEKISDEEKARKVQELGPIIDDHGVELAADDRAGIQSALERVHLIRNKKYVPDDENRDFVLGNIERRNQLLIEGKALEVKRDAYKKSLKEQRELQTRKENAFNRLVAQETSVNLEALDTKRQEAYNSLEGYDFKQRDLLEAHLVKILKSGASWSKSFNELPADLQQIFLDTEKASQEYQAILKEIETAKISEALAGNLGEDIQRQAVELYGENSLQQKITTMSRQLDETEYIEIAAVKAETDQLLEAYIQRVLNRYFSIRWVAVKDVLATPNTSDDQYRELFKSLETGLSMWRARVLISKPTGEASSLY